MRISLALVYAVGMAVAVVVAVRGGNEPAAGQAGALTLVGDSLNVGTEPYLRKALPEWQIDAYDRVGRTTSEGIEELRRLGDRLAPVVVVSLGTNDPDGSETQFRALVAEAIAIVGPARCLVWATIVRDGAGRAGFDRVLEEASSAHANVRLVDWTGTVAADGSLLAGYLVHSTPDGYARRAQETARSIGACPGPRPE